MFQNNNYFFSYYNINTLFSLFLFFVLFFVVSYILIKNIFIKQKGPSVTISLIVAFLAVFYLSEAQEQFLEEIFRAGGLLLISFVVFFFFFILIHAFESPVFRKIFLVLYGVLYTYFSFNKPFWWIILAIIISLIFLDDKIHEILQDKIKYKE